MRRGSCLAGVVALACAGTGRAAPVVGDASFEAANTGAPGYIYDPADAGGWSFSGLAGVASNGAAFGFSNAPDGHQVGFVQSACGDNAGAISQTITGLTVGATCTLSFDLAACPAPHAANPIFLVSSQTVPNPPGTSPPRFPCASGPSRRLQPASRRSAPPSPRPTQRPPDLLRFGRQHGPGPRHRDRLGGGQCPGHHCRPRACRQGRARRGRARLLASPLL